MIYLEKVETIRYWVETSAEDYRALGNLFKSGDYHWSLFMGHIVIEKLLKALFVQNNPEGSNVPRIHDLMTLSQKARLDVDDEKADLLDLISTFNISARYPDYKRTFYLKCTREYTAARIDEINGVRAWLLSLIK
ncbi:MAG: HEPN domain-containing protein [Oscillospiraceae bacterium]|nr:HEPN domain-containing protein [Oscillospiraceae bacterium]